MRKEASTTSISWIPSEAIEGMTKLPFEMGVAHYDEAPPAHIDDLEALRDADRFRFANRLAAWIDVDDAGRITGHGYSGGGFIGATTMRLGGFAATFAAVPFPDRQQPPEVGDGWVRFCRPPAAARASPRPAGCAFPRSSRCPRRWPGRRSR